MKSQSRVFVVLITLLMLQACVNHTEIADTAFLKDDWDTAVSSYSEALKREKDLAEINRLKQRLMVSKQKGADAHLEASRSSKSIGDIAAAYSHASFAFSYVQSDEARYLLNDLKAPERDRLIVLAELRLHEKAWNDAIQLLESANKVDWSQKGTDLLARVKKEQVEYNFSMFESLVGKAREALQGRDWKQASHLYQNAIQYGTSPQVERELAFSALMFETEGHASKASYDSNSSKRAEDGFRKALDYGLDQVYVRARLSEVELNDYELVFHSAVISPQKPNTNSPWDGFGSLSGAGANLMSNLGGYFIDGGVISSQLVKLLANTANQGIAAPDSFLTVYVDGQAFGGINYKRQNDYRPEWGMAIKFSNVNKLDNRIISLHVVDADESNHDNIGSVQFKLSELLQTEGVQNKVLFDERGKLFAQGLLAVTISSRRM